MILADANLLLYAYNADAPQHEQAREWLEKAMSGPATFALSWQTITAFIRITTNIRAFAEPLSIREAIDIASGWQQRPGLTILLPTERHWAIFSRLLDEGQVAGALVMDAHLAALAIEHGATLTTTDRDFARFKELTVINPLTRT